ncbi:capsule biosynthesis GfcC family protein [Paraglaciecola marina]|uniref:capsule biosynthesis GfcC family protein n=1 Tax=Paraglaciecola marina TaxID=2500157 RepID=UPI0010602A83|nr:capsule biosynthesis GfcC family protein [Paraglaciecola marina]
MRVFLFICVLGWSSFSAASVKITINDTVFDYEGNPKLSEVLEPIALERSWYWQSSALFRVGDSTIDKERSFIIEELLALTSSLDDVKVIRQLVASLESWNLARRLAIPIDFDLARVQPKFNPKFEDGEYLLLLKERVETVSIIGLVNESTVIEYKGNVAAMEYLSDIKATDLSDKSLIYIVQGNGEVKKSGVAYWNNSYDHVMAGSQIYIPFTESQFSKKMDILNMKIAKLATNRIIK